MIVWVIEFYQRKLMPKKPKYHIGSNCKFCGQALTQRRQAPKPHKKWYYLVKYYCSVCRLSFCNDGDKSFLSNPKDDIFRKVKKDTAIHREFRKIAMDWFRGLKSEIKKEALKEFHSFKEMWQ